MTSSFAKFKKNRTSISDLQQKIEETEGAKENYQDDRFWYPARDKATKKGEAVIRFLPVKEDDETKDEAGNVVASANGIPWVKTFSHSYQNEQTGKWYIEECPTTIGEKCPMCEANSELWNTGTEANKDLVRKRKRRLQYISNILVVSDPANPENEGKVFLFKYGKKIHDILDKKINPEYESQKPVNVFDMWDGANFALRIGMKDGWTNYDASEFLPSTEVGTDEEKEEIYNSLYNISEFIAPAKFKDYATLKTRLDFVDGIKTAGGNPIPKGKSEYEDSSGYDSVDENSFDNSESSDEGATDEQTSFFENLSKYEDD